MGISEIRTPNGILDFMEENIKYGWLGTDGKIRIYSMQEFRQYYKTLSLEETLDKKIGVCIEQVYLMHHLMNKIGIESKMYCTRMYEDENFNDLEAAERMHCFLLYFIDDKVFQIEHPNGERKGIYEYESEEDAIQKIVSIYEEMMREEYEEKNLPEPLGGFRRITTVFEEVPVGISYKDFNLYINSLGSVKGNKKIL